METTLQHPWLWGRTGELPPHDQATATTSQNGFFMQLNKPTKHQVLMLEVGFFWICCGKGGSLILSWEQMNARARYSPVCSGLSPFLWELACSFLPWCAKILLKSKREMENHMKATLTLCVMCSARGTNQRSPCLLEILPHSAFLGRAPLHRTQLFQT